MPKKPTDEFIKIARKTINPVDVLRATLNDVPELKDAAIQSEKFTVVEVPDEYQPTSEVINYE